MRYIVVFPAPLLGARLVVSMPAPPREPMKCPRVATNAMGTGGSCALLFVVDDVVFNGVQGIEQEMRIHLAAQHGLFQGDHFSLIP